MSVIVFLLLFELIMIIICDLAANIQSIIETHIILFNFFSCEVDFSFNLCIFAKKNCVNDRFEDL